MKLEFKIKAKGKKSALCTRHIHAYVGLTNDMYVQPWCLCNHRLLQFNISTIQNQCTRLAINTFFFDTFFPLHFASFYIGFAMHSRLNFKQNHHKCRICFGVWLSLVGILFFYIASLERYVRPMCLFLGQTMYDFFFFLLIFFLFRLFVIQRMLRFFCVVPLLFYICSTLHSMSVGLYLHMSDVQTFSFPYFCGFFFVCKLFKWKRKNSGENRHI